MAEVSKRAGCGTRGSEEVGAPPVRGLDLRGQDPLAERLRALVGRFIEDLVTKELDEALGVGRYERSRVEGEAVRRGYRHTWRRRELGTSLGPAAIGLQQARIFGGEGAPSVEWRSALLPRYARRMRAVDDAILGCYLAGANSRRIRGALRPPLHGSPLSRSAVSRVVQRLKATFAAWRAERLEEKANVYLFLNAIGVKVRIGGAVESVPILVALGVNERGEKELLGLRLVGSESAAAWQAIAR